MLRIHLPATIIKVAIWISVISVFAFTYQLIFTRKIQHGIQQYNTSIRKTVFRYDQKIKSTARLMIVPSSTASTTTTLNPRVKTKIKMLHSHLNDTKLVHQKMFPAVQIGKFLMVNPTICRDAHRVDVVVIVHTAPSHMSDRQRIRDSFGKKELFVPFNVRVAFLLGTTLDPKLESVLMMEQTRHGDLVMGDFVDAYHNLTLKGVMGYRWVSEYCSNSKYVLKIDDDVLINMYKFLYSFLNHMHGKPKSIFCNVWSNNTMPILRTGKWKVPNHMFSHMRAFPYNYCSGFVVVMTSDLMAPMYHAAKLAPFFWIDDVYLFGILPSIVGGVTYYNYPLDKNTSLNDKVVINCTITLGSQCPIFATIISQSAYWNLWGMIKKNFEFTSWKKDITKVD